MSLGRSKSTCCQAATINAIDNLCPLAVRVGDMLKSTLIRRNEELLAIDRKKALLQYPPRWSYEEFMHEEAR